MVACSTATAGLPSHAGVHVRASPRTSRSRGCRGNSPADRSRAHGRSSPPSLVQPRSRSTVLIGRLDAADPSRLEVAVEHRRPRLFGEQVASTPCTGNPHTAGLTRTAATGSRRHAVVNDRTLRARARAPGCPVTSVRSSASSLAHQHGSSPRATNGAKICRVARVRERPQRFVVRRLVTAITVDRAVMLCDGVIDRPKCLLTAVRSAGTIRSCLTEARVAPEVRRPRESS
jgi:hypothetical protein